MEVITGAPKNRKERRMLRQGLATLRPADTGIKVVTEIEGIIRIPTVTGTGSIFPYMIPLAMLDPKYRAHYTRHDNISPASTIEQYNRLLTVWFFDGISKWEPVLRPNVVGGAAPADALGIYIREIMSSFEPSHEYKYAYLAYVLDTCCLSVVWAPKERNRG